MAKHGIWELKALATLAGFSDEQSKIIAAIAMAESGGDDDAHALTPKEDSWGVLQINLRAHKDITQAEARDARKAMQYAYKLSKGGTTFTDWSAYNNDSYLRFLTVFRPDNPPGGTPNEPVDLTGGTTAVDTLLGLTGAEWRDAGLGFGLIVLGVALVGFGLYGLVIGGAVRVVESPAGRAVAKAVL